MDMGKALAGAVSNSLNEALNAPKCSQKESAALVEAALVAMHNIAKEMHGFGSESAAGSWRRQYDDAARSSKTRGEFLEKFAALTDSFDGAPLPGTAGLFLREASCDALLAANPDAGRRWRLDALTHAGIATGALAMLVNPAELEARAITRLAQMGAAARHKDSRADRAHVGEWLRKNRDQYRTDAERVDAILAGKEVAVVRATVARWVMEWNRAQRVKQIPPTV